jgi:hypothetical protein
MPKRLLTLEDVALPSAGDSKTFEAESLNRREKFLIDANRRGKIALLRCTYQERYRVVDILARLDVGGTPHTNPSVEEVPHAMLKGHNGVTLPCPHLHFYVEGFDDRWAVPAPLDSFPRLGDLTATLEAFMRYCGIAEAPSAQGALY